MTSASMKAKDQFIGTDTVNENQEKANMLKHTALDEAADTPSPQEEEIKENIITPDSSLDSSTENDESNSIRQEEGGASQHNKCPASIPEEEELKKKDTTNDDIQEADQDVAETDCVSDFINQSASQSQYSASTVQTKTTKQLLIDAREYKPSDQTINDENYDLVTENTEIKISVPPPPPDVPPAESKASSGRSKMTQQQQTLMIESGKLLEHLRKEVYKLRKQNGQLKNDFRNLQDNNQRLMDANGSLGETFGTLYQHAKQVSKTNARLKKELQSTKGQFDRERLEHQNQIDILQMQQMELKDELTMKQETYIEEVHERLHLQKVMTRIVDTVQERCRDHRLVEDILAMSDECEF